MSAIDRRESRDGRVTNPDPRRGAANLRSSGKSPVAARQLITPSGYLPDLQDAAALPVLQHAEALSAEWARAA
jgi:hypothetical protein